MRQNTQHPWQGLVTALHQHPVEVDTRQLGTEITARGNDTFHLLSPNGRMIGIGVGKGQDGARRHLDPSPGFRSAVQIRPRRDLHGSKSTRHQEYRMRPCGKFSQKCIATAAALGAVCVSTAARLSVGLGYRYVPELTEPRGSFRSMRHPARRKPCEAPSPGLPPWVTGGKPESEYMCSALPQVADIARSAFHRITRSGSEQFHARLWPNNEHRP